MAGPRFEAKLTTRNSRAALSIGLHWRCIDSNLHLGYKKGHQGAQWVVRWYIGNKKYRQKTLGATDDVLGEGNLSFDAASKLARDATLRGRKAKIAGAEWPPETVRSVVERYIEIRDARHSARVGRTVRSDAASRLGLHVLGDSLADVELYKLTENDLCAWKTRLSPRLMLASRWRTLSDLRSALNIAHLRYRQRLPERFGDTIKYGLRRDDIAAPLTSSTPTKHVLSDDVVRKIIQAAASYDSDGDVWRMILVLAATGARFSQVQRLQVQDLQCGRSRLMMPTSRKGRNRPEAYYPVQIGGDVIAALKPVADGRAGDEPLLRRQRYAHAGSMMRQQERRGWTSASELTRPWKAICASVMIEGAVPYTLRHSSIVRSIRTGLPIRLVAAIHDTSVTMIERHYSRHIVDGMEELAARAVVPLVGAPRST